LGFILRDDLIGVDLDGCRDDGTGEIADWATKIIDLLNSYTEVSPSGTGNPIFIVVAAAKPLY
jgi:primase-polymerase (primpol)-like protein